MHINVEGSAPSGEPEVFATVTPGGVDDIFVDQDRSIYVATRAEEILRADETGQVSHFSDEGCEGCTSLAVDRSHGPRACSF